MYRWTTPTITLILPEGYDLSEASNVYVTFTNSKGASKLRKSGDDLSIDENVVGVELTQEETGGMPEMTFVQVNWTYIEDNKTKRDATKKAVLFFEDNNESGAIE